MVVCVVRVTFYLYSKTCVKRPLKNRQSKDLINNGSFMKVEIIADCAT